MAVVKTTYGTTEQFVRSALLGLGATAEDPNGRFYLDGTMVHAELSRAIAEAIYIGEIFRDGQSVTGKYSTDADGSGAVRVMLDTPFDFTSRTLAYGGRKGTPGNNGSINVNPPLMPTNDEFIVYMNQVNDQSLLFPDISKTMIPLDTMSKKISSYALSVVQDRTASTLAEILAYSIMRSLNDGDNLNGFDVTSTEDNRYGTLLNKLNTKLDNGDRAASAFTFSTQGRTVIGRPAFINGIFNKNSGVILNGNDLAQVMLREYDLDAKVSDRNYVGQNYKGMFGQFHFQSAPDYIWTLAEKYLGLAEGALNNVHAIAVSFECTATAALVDLGVKIIDANEVRGSKAQPLNKWGHETFRKCQIIAAPTFTNTTLTGLGFTADERRFPVAPALAAARNQITLPIYDATGTVIGYKVVAEGIQPNGGNWSNEIPVV